MAKPAENRSVGRPLTLLWAFVALSALILGAGGYALGSLLTQAVRDQALEDAKTSLTQYADSVLGPHLVSGNRLGVGGDFTPTVMAGLAQRPDIFSVKVWSRDGTLVWASQAQVRIGERVPPSGELRQVLETGAPVATLRDLDPAVDGLEASLGRERVLEVWAPVRTARAVVGAYDVYADPAAVDAAVAERRREMWVATATVFAVLWILLLLLARSASRRLVSQQSELGDAYEALEENALEAIESLNAAVEAKDPFIAGHSLRVQRVALGLGRELAVEGAQLDALRFGSLFHDIGKLAVPDRILTKPGPLTSAEYETMKLHADEGARIVGKFGRLRDTVPIVLHHHERWDGGGYPHGLAGRTIPLGATIVALADAWDSMTVERAYSGARGVDEALDELRAGRGTQFAPAVVDAFLDLVERDPAIVRAVATAAEEFPAVHA